MTTEILPTRVEEFIKQMTPRAPGHQVKAIAKFVLAIIDKQTGNQAELAPVRILTDFVGIVLVVRIGKSKKTRQRSDVIHIEVIR